MSAPRDIRLVRVRDLRAAHHVIAALTTSAPDRGRAVLVPTAGARWQLRRTLDRIVALEGWQPTAADLRRLGLLARASGVGAVCDLLTRDEWYRRLHAEAHGAPEWVAAFDREVLLRAACDAALAAGIAPPFQLRPGLMPAILALYDAIRRRRRTVDDLERLLVGALEPTADSDRGGRRMLQQTRFLVAALRDYESRLVLLDLLDEHRARDWILASETASPHGHLVLALGDDIAEKGGLWPADFDVLTRLPAIARIDVIVTETMLASGLHERILNHLPGIEECRPRDLDAVPPTLVIPRGEEGRRHFLSRDREEELADAIRRLVARDASVGPLASVERCVDSPAHVGGEAAAGPARRIAAGDVALVYQRPLPYLYLGRQLLDSVGIPYQAFDALPLAAEPYAAALDLVFEFVLSDHGRAATVALLRSPHFHFEVEGRVVDGAAVSALDLEMIERGYVGDRTALQELADMLEESSSGVDEGDPAVAARASAMAAEQLAALSSPAPATAHLEVLAAFLDQHDAPPQTAFPFVERHLRARAAVRSAIAGLRRAHQSHADGITAFSDVAAALKRWIEAHTFEPLTGDGGLQLVDDQAARFGRFSAVHLLGLVEGEWPAAPTRDIFYPPSLLRDLGWPKERDRSAAARAAFVDLLRLAKDETSLSAFVLEDDAIVRTSVMLEDVDDAALAVRRVDGAEPPPIFPYERLAADGAEGVALSADACAWLALRQSRSDPGLPEFHGAAGRTDRPVHSVTSLETYLDCPFRYFAARVLRLDEERLEEPGLDARERGRFVHAVLQRFFEEWEAAGHGAITPETLPAARDRFRRLVEEMLQDLPETDRAIERARLLGSAVATGLGERAFRLEAERPDAVVERRLEVDLSGDYTFGTGDGARRVTLRGIADRIDLLDGTLRIIDYKTGGVPDVRRAVQLPVYAVCAEERFDGYRGRSWRVADAAYVAFGEKRPYVAVIGGPEQRDRAVDAASRRLLETVDRIGRGEFPPRPAEWRLCGVCAWAAVCRKDYVDAE